VFIDTLQIILAGRVALPADEAEFARSLPVMRPADVDDLGQLSVEVLLVDPQRTSARFVARELQACGFRVATAQRSYEALELAARTRPTRRGRRGHRRDRRAGTGRHAALGQGHRRDPVRAPDQLRARPPGPATAAPAPP
jgi:CheY-like chemotaxis protein